MKQQRNIYEENSNSDIKKTRLRRALAKAKPLVALMLEKSIPPKVILSDSIKKESGNSIDNEKVPLEELQVREAISTFLWLGFLFVITILIKVHLDSSPHAAAIGVSKAPWVFGSIQWLLQRLPVWLSGWFIPLLSGAILLTLPWWELKVGQRWARIIFLILSFVWVGLTFLYWFQD
ncbi:hypothetical protein [Desulfitobacterium sp.]|uniref:hypothetical protein n=1 Tax=Desulfitobacterium sp. TaxID=49981 RepID=UPI002B1F4660|nr:hypothetical protein [Desulfitobacterium sp.]MEA4902762.1 hypothetical protein [Desulfitobacterium sp.]